MDDEYKKVLCDDMEHREDLRHLHGTRVEYEMPKIKSRTLPVLFRFFYQLRSFVCVIPHVPLDEQEMMLAILADKLTTFLELPHPMSAKSCQQLRITLTYYTTVI